MVPQSMMESGLRPWNTGKHTNLTHVLGAAATALWKTESTGKLDKP